MADDRFSTVRCVSGRLPPPAPLPSFLLSKATATRGGKGWQQPRHGEEEAESSALTQKNDLGSSWGEREGATVGRPDAQSRSDDEGRRL